MTWFPRRLAASAFALAGLGISPAHAQYYAPEPPPTALPWYEAFELRAFVDAYASVNYNFPKPHTGTNRFRAFDTANGFSLSWVGLDARYDPDPVGGTLSLRFGPAAEAWANRCLSPTTDCDSALGLQYVKQAFVSWKPGGAGSAWTLDFGKFDTLYGVEAAESQDNYTYTRGLLRWLGQPLFHTGIRANLELLPELSLSALAVNGWNNSIDNNFGKSIGLQASISPVRELMVRIGWLGGPEQDDFAEVTCASGTQLDPNSLVCVPADPSTRESVNTIDRGGANAPEAFRHFVDLVMAYQPNEVFGLLLNGSYGTEGERVSLTTSDTEQRSWYGASLSARYALNPVWALGARGEYYADPEGHTTGVTDAKLASGTLTIEAAPMPNLILRLDTRGDFALDGDPSDELFKHRVRDQRSTQLTSTLGVVVTTN